MLQIITVTVETMPFGDDAEDVIWSVSDGEHTRSGCVTGRGLARAEVVRQASSAVSVLLAVRLLGGDK